uniref:Uncharacterized protein n=1 Tax=Oryza rufipogon TaxID=4529 RepID=A0A0E0P4R2_ORYRU
MPPAQPISKLLDNDQMEFLDKVVDPEATSKDCNGDNSVMRAGETTLQAIRIQQLSSESKKLSMNVEHIIAQVSQAMNLNCRAEENPVILPKHSDVVSARGLKHSEIKVFQELLKQRPVQKDVVLKKISINLDLWSNFFSKPPPELIRIMEGLRVLKGALPEEAPLPTTNLVLTQQDQTNKHVNMLQHCSRRGEFIMRCLGSTDESI